MTPLEEPTGDEGARIHIEEGRDIEDAETQEMLERLRELPTVVERRNELMAGIHLTPEQEEKLRQKVAEELSEMGMGLHEDATEIKLFADPQRTTEEGQMMKAGEAKALKAEGKIETQLSTAELPEDDEELVKVYARDNNYNSFEVIVEAEMFGDLVAHEMSIDIYN